MNKMNNGNLTLVFFLSSSGVNIKKKNKKKGAATTPKQGIEVKNESMTQHHENDQRSGMRVSNSFCLLSLHHQALGLAPLLHILSSNPNFVRRDQPDNQTQNCSIRSHPIRKRMKFTRQNNKSATPPSIPWFFFYCLFPLLLFVCFFSQLPLIPDPLLCIASRLLGQSVLSEDIKETIPRVCITREEGSKMLTKEKTRKKRK